MKTKAVIALTIFLIIYLTGLYVFTSVGNKSFEYRNWTSDGGEAFGAFSGIGLIVYLVLTGGILSNEIKIKK
jgi:hypothetical protein